ncbi:cytochrome P450 [Collybia nuda]|uniref:Cytochrome P450 n=1 Tax=Collybia nuda TaxID=64659 RepID=A0A9P5YE25_9AGAR|nr:cytochrome P450 [Collybia nuda]
MDYIAPLLENLRTVQAKDVSASVLITSGLWLVWKILTVGRREKGLPPGPPTVPFLGNVHKFPAKHVAMKFTEWAKQYGAIYSLKISHSTAIVVSDMTVVKELMDMRAADTANRSTVHIGEVVTDGFHMALSPYGSDVWRISKKALQSFLAPQAITSYRPIAYGESTQMLYDVLHSPKDFYTHIQRATFSFTTSVVFGWRCPSYESQELSMFFESVRLWMKLASSETPPIDLFPILKYVPERWASWKTVVKRTRELQHEIYFRMLGQAEHRLSEGESKGNDCFIERCIQNQASLGMSREFIAHLGGVCLEAGSETTSALVLSVLLCLVAYPEEQRKCQEEIDRVIGSSRSPVVTDYASLPYVQAFVREVHRFRPVAPLGMPHATMKDMEYRGYYIPKGATIFLNLWGVYHNPDSFDRPEEFLPERYLLSEHGTKPGANGDDFRNSLPFGSGKRLCPGMHLANTAAQLHIMNLLWGFKFDPAVDPKTGKSLPVNINIDAYNSGVTLVPVPFDCTITSRGRDREDIIEKQFIEVSETFVKFEQHLK